MIVIIHMLVLTAITIPKINLFLILEAYFE